LIFPPRAAPSRVRNDRAAAADDEGEREGREQGEESPAGQERRGSRASEPPIGGSFDHFFALCAQARKQVLGQQVEWGAWECFMAVEVISCAPGKIVETTLIRPPDQAWRWEAQKSCVHETLASARSLLQHPDQVGMRSGRAEEGSWAVQGHAQRLRRLGRGCTLCQLIMLVRLSCECGAQRSGAQATARILPRRKKDTHSCALGSFVCHPWSFAIELDLQSMFVYRRV
jgi:hypothetical protein